MILGYTQITDDVGDIKRQNDMIMSYAAGHNISPQTVYSLPSTEKLKKEILKKAILLLSAILPGWETPCLKSEIV